MTTTSGAHRRPDDPHEPGREADPLAPVRAALLARANADAAAVLQEADAAAEEVLARAREAAEAARAAARAAGVADGAALVAADRARARRTARSVVLAAQRRAYEDLVARLDQALPSLRSDPAYPAWRERAAATVRGTLGAATAVTELPGGGVVGDAPGRRATVALDALAAAALAALDVQGLWAP